MFGQVRSYQFNLGQISPDYSMLGWVRTD